uniref:Uncharacterized protein n=1 Tax=Solanum lycopersicum TaxID=4081 RepID=A0A494G9T3_SOLLC
MRRARIASASRARQSPQARSRGKQGGDELYSQRLCAPGWAASQSEGGRRVSRRRKDSGSCEHTHERRNLQARKHAVGAQ